MAGRLSFSVAVNLLTENFNRGSNQLRSGLRNIQMQAMTMFAAFGAGSWGLGEFVTNLITTARETNRYTTALKNVSGGAKEYLENQKFLIELSQKYGLYVNDLTGNFSKFTAAATVANMSMKDQQFIFESLSRASTGFGLSADETNGVFLAVTQMMGKGKIQAEELRGQLGERMPIAMQAMAKAAGTTVAGLDKIMKAGKLLSADIMPKFAKALNEMLPNVSTDNVETSFNRLKNKFKELTDALNVGSMYKGLLDQTNTAFSYILGNLKTVGNGILNIVASVIIGKAFLMVVNAYKTLEVTALKFYKKQALMSGVAFDEMAYNANKFKNISTVAFAKVGLALKAAFMSFAPMIIISGLIAIYQHFADIEAKTRELKAVWTDYQSGFKNAGNNDAQVQNLKGLKKIIDDSNSSLLERKNALKSINDILGTNYQFDKDGKKINGDINDKIKDRIALLTKAAQLNYLINKNADAGTKLGEAQNNKEIDEKQFKIYDERIKKAVAGSGKKFLGQNIGGVANSSDIIQRDLWKNKFKDDSNDVNAYQTVYDSSLKELTKRGGAIVASNTNSNTNGGSVKPATTVKETELEKAEKDHIQQLTEYNNQLANGVISVVEYNELFDKLVKDSKEKIGGLLTPAQAKNDVLFQTLKNQKTLTIPEAEKVNPKDKDLSKYDYASPYTNLGKTGIELADINLESAKKELDDLKSLALKTTEDLTVQLDEKLSNVTTLDKALNLLEVKKQVKDLQSELSTGVYSGVKDIANSAKNLYEGFKAVSDTISNVDSTGWDKFLSVWDALTNTVDSIMSVVKMIENLTKLTTDLGIAKSLVTTIDTVSNTTQIANIGTQAAAKVAAASIEVPASMAIATAARVEMAALTAASYAAMPFIGQGLALAQIGVLNAAILASAVPFATGGVVGGTSYTGDKILARVNSGELILNQQQQNKLLNEGGSNGGGTVKFKIEGKDLVGTIANYNKIKSKV